MSFLQSHYVRSNFSLRSWLAAATLALAACASSHKTAEPTKAPASTATPAPSTQASKPAPAQPASQTPAAQPSKSAPAEHAAAQSGGQAGASTSASGQGDAAGLASGHAPTQAQAVASQPMADAVEPVALAAKQSESAPQVVQAEAAQPVAKAQGAAPVAAGDAAKVVAVHIDPRTSNETTIGRDIGPNGPEPSIFGEPVIVYGKQITDDQIKRYLCFGTGRQSVQYSPVDMLKFNVMIEQELGRRKKAGEDVSKFVITDEMNANKLAKDKADFVEKYPTLDFPTEVGRSFLSLDLYMEHQKNLMAFDRLFIPDNPDEWPDATTAVVMEFGGDLFVQDAKDSHMTRKTRMLTDRLKKAELARRAAAGQAGDGTLDAETEARLQEQAAEQAKTYVVTNKDLDELQPDDPIFTDTLRQLVLQALNNYAVIHTDMDQILADLPDAAADSPSDPKAREKQKRERARAVLLTVEGVPIMTDEVWQRIAPFCTPDLVEDAKRFLVLNALLERDLAAKNMLIPTSEFREWWPQTARVNPQTGEKPKMSYQEYLNNHEMLSSQVLGYPSLFHFATHTRIEESFRKSIADELAKDENLIPLMPQINQIAGAAKVNIEVLLCSAYDFTNVRWKDNGWATAKAKALDLKKQLDGGAQWTPILELNSEFWDPPMPEVGSKPQFGYLFKGKFGEQTRNQLLQYMSESEYRIYLYGAPCISDYVFFEQKMGSIDGPFRGPKGYYLTRLTGKTPFSRPLDIKEPVHREILEFNYLKNKMNARAQELLARGAAEGQVKGIPLGGGIKDV